jgi:hypothetical protein
MIYSITFRKRAAQEYLEAIAWYKNRSIVAAENFVNSVKETLDAGLNCYWLRTPKMRRMMD